MAEQKYERRYKMLSTEMQKLKQQNYFPIPNAVFDLDLTDGEILVYAFLLRCEDRRTYQCHPSYTTIGRAITIYHHTFVVIKRGIYLSKQFHCC